MNRNTNSHILKSFHLFVIAVLLVGVFSLTPGRSVQATELDVNGSLQWRTLMGSSGEKWSDLGLATAVDGIGNVYVAGRSSATWGSPVKPHSGSDDAFVAKLDSNGNLQWNTFMGSSDSDRGSAIAVDSDGNIYVTGLSYATWGSPKNDYTPNNSNPNDCFSNYRYSDIFVVKLNNDGDLQWNTFMGSPGIDSGNSIAVDGNGNIYVAGSSDTTWGEPVNAHNPADYSDAFAAKLDSSGSLKWNTFMGAAGQDLGSAIAVDGSGNVYVAGSSDATWGEPVNNGPGAGVWKYDAFAAKVDSSVSLQWNRLLGSDKGRYGDD